MNQHEALKQAIRNMKDKENSKVIEYINDPETDLSYNKFLLFRMSCEYHNFAVFKYFVENKSDQINFDACAGKPLISCVKWELEEFVDILINQCNVNVKNRGFTAYATALNKENKKIIDLFNSKINLEEYDDHYKMEYCRSLIIGNDFEKFKHFLENNQLSKKKYQELSSVVCSRCDIDFLKLYLEINKKIQFITMSKLLTYVLKTHKNNYHVNILIDNMSERDYGYGDEVIVRKLVINQDLYNFKKVVKNYDFDFSLFDNKILKSALKRKVKYEFIKIILSHKSMTNKFNQEWYENNKELVDNYPNAYKVRQYLCREKILLF